MAGIGDNSVGGIAGERLRSFVERIERLEEEKRALAGDIKEVYAEAKGTGFDVKVLRQLIRERSTALRLATPRLSARGWRERRPATARHARS